MMGKSIAIFHAISGGTTITLLLRFVPIPLMLHARPGFRFAAILASLPKVLMELGEREIYLNAAEITEMR